jgi:GAF domain-containing protein
MEDGGEAVATREALLSQTFVQLADTLVDDFDVVDLLTVLANRCVELLDADAAGILLADAQGVLHVIAASSEEARLLELFQLQNEEGPCFECFRTGQPIVNRDLQEPNNWPRFAAEARATGYRSVQAVPLRVRSVVIGALNVFLADRSTVADADMLVASALADVATIAVLQQRARSESELVVQQLQGALNSRIAIEQAKGMLSERAAIGMDEAFARLRAHARSTSTKLSDVAAALVEGSLPQQDLDKLVATPSKM